MLTRRDLLHRAAALAFLARAAARDGHSQPTDLAPILRGLCQKHNVPALTACSFTSDRITALGVFGTRRSGIDDPATLEDLWQIASCTKSMVGHLAAVKVERGVLAWDRTLAELLPALADKMHSEYRNVTLLDVLMHRAGIQPFRSPTEGIPLVPYGAGRANRELATRMILSKPPAAKPKEKSRYSNGGYVVAAHAIETAADTEWESLMQSHVFEPLAIKIRWGLPITIDDAAQPWGHLNTRPTEPMPFGHIMSPPPVMRPAGGVSCAIEHFARFVQDHLRGVRSIQTDPGAGPAPEPAQPPPPQSSPAALLKPESYRVLHTPVGSFSACWNVRERGAFGLTSPIHYFYGSPLCFYSLMAIAPALDRGIVVCTNSGIGQPACDDAAARLFA